MKISYLMICMCIAGLVAACSCLGQEQGRGERALQKEGREKGAFRGGGDGAMMGGDGAQEAIIGKIANNPRIISELGLSDDQVKTLKNSTEEMRKQHEDFQKQLKEAGLEQAKLMIGDSMDENAILAAVEKTGKIRTEMAKARIKHMLLVKKTLTPAQTGKIRDMVQSHMKQLPGGDMRNQKGKNEGETWKDKRLKKHQQEEKKDDVTKPAGPGI